MGLPEILLEHKRGEKQSKKLRVKATRKLFVIGSSDEADLRIAGEDVKGCHAALRLRETGWYICDISGSENVKVNGQVVSEAKVDGATQVEIAGHVIQLFAKERKTELFNEVTEATGALTHHQVVVRSPKGKVLETKVLDAKESFSYNDGERVAKLPAPQDGKWIKTKVGVVEIQQRLVSKQEMIAAEQLEFDRDLRKPLVLAVLVFLFLIGSVLIGGRLAPEKKPEVALDKKSLDIIYNAKAIQKKKVEAQKITKTAKAKAGGTTEAPQVQVAKNSAPEESTAPKVSEKATAALTSLRKSGLSNLVGKIAKRANKQGIMVAAQGVAPDKEGSGRAFFSTGTSTTGGGGSAAKEGPSFKLGGVATKGKAGGTGDYKGGTALAGGSVGSGDIVAMVDEETVIEGGLDRDAIAEVIRRNLGQIRYCYERQLSSNPDLYGKVLVKFTIGAQGEVAAQRVENSTLKSAMVEGCIMRRMASWTFPQPKGGTQVNVSYPFLFKAN